MKRHKYVFPNYLKKFNKPFELNYLALKFLKNQKILKNLSLFFCLRRNLQRNYLP